MLFRSGLSMSVITPAATGADTAQKNTGVSVSGNIKEEISRQLSPARHCRIAELAAIISMCGAVMIDSRGHAALKIHTENLAVARKSFTLLRRTFNIVVDIAIRVNREKGSSYYYIVVKKHEDAIRVLQAAKLLNPYGEIGRAHV